MNFCTYFDVRYIHKGILLYRSLEKTCGEFNLWILCLDDVTHETLLRLGLKHVHLIRCADFEASDKALNNAKKDRKRIEYYWTCTPGLVLYIFRQNQDMQRLVYLDADMYFFSNPAAIFDELGNNSVLLNLQDLSPERLRWDSSGKYNVGAVAFNRDWNSINCLNWWRERCLEECVYDPGKGKYGDQLYLDDWTKRFQGVAVSNNAGLRAAPWNISKYAVCRNEKNEVTINGSRLVCYHFHALFFCTRSLVFLTSWESPMEEAVKKYIYTPYIIGLLAAEKELKKAGSKAALPIKGIPWRYIAGRFVKLQPFRNFLWVGMTGGKDEPEPSRQGAVI